MNIRRAHSHGKPWLLPYMKGGDAYDCAKLTWKCIEEVDGTLMFYKADTGELFHKCRKAAEEGGDIPYQNEEAGTETVGESAFRRIFGEAEDIEDFISMLREQNKRYANVQMTKIVSLAKTYSVGQVEAAIRYCLRVKICSLNEIQAYYCIGTALA